MPQTEDPASVGVTAVFEQNGLAAIAHHALLAAGIPADAVELIGPTEPRSQAGGFWASIGRLFASTQALHRADMVGHDHAMIVVRPASPAEREIAIATLEGCGPLAFDVEPVPPPSKQPARSQFVRIVEERVRVGWRGRLGKAGRGAISQPLSRQRVTLEEEEIGDRRSGS